MRKGIYQAFDAVGNVEADELWQWVKRDDGTIQIDNETTRIKPFAEPRSDSITYMLSADLSPSLFTAHGLLGHRESRINWVDDEAYICWQYKFETHRREVAWGDDVELGFISPLLNMVIVWRSNLKPHQRRAFRLMQMDGVTFEPKWLNQTYLREDDEMRQTEFGEQNLSHYRVETRSLEGQAIKTCEFWCDAEGVLFDLRDSDGGGYKLTAVNF